jgi:hypothetical protein
VNLPGYAALVLVLCAACTPAAMPVVVSPFEIEPAAVDMARLSFQVDETSYERAVGTIGDPSVLGYPIDARVALRESTTTAVVRTFPNAAINGSSYPKVVVRLQDFDVDRDVDASGAFTYRFVAEATVTLRVDVWSSPDIEPVSVSVTGRVSRSAVGNADRMERQYGRLIRDSIEAVARDAITQAMHAIAERVRADPAR